MTVASTNLNSLGLFVADHVTAMLAYWDKDLICRFANDAYRHWFGKTREEMIDKITIKELLGPLYEKNLPYISGALAGEVQTFERVIPIPSGGVRYSIATYFPDVVDDEVHGFIAHVADITPIKLLEIDLVKSKEIIEYQNKSLLNFANIVSHNLKNYAQSFSGMIELLQYDYPKELHTEIIKELRTVSTNFSETIKNIGEIVYAQNTHNIIPEAINLYEYIIKNISTVRVQADANKAIIINNVKSDIMLMGNPAYIESILLNLLTNAIKYRHPDRIPIIEINCVVENDFIVLSVADNGRGIDLEKYGQKLFGMYNKFHGNADAQGIGLYITKFQIEAMGGYITVESEENRGTIFTVHFKQSKNI